ncbi:hypothetical protein LY90DRAFT_705682 [Neocallimastix californiae]|uniref:Uncharacterized protein n=1 Tax=Neocallimastix californiae TaxID=1754190 RepID=A0A1Y2B1W1_9FUNG|nr:hypothetical protein LY90DRAFT_705682 [Neocallimastix californiae]|eukprot:ORY28540.1 hypothetical protein LY90DRAFT_705682 [Neocallimastix californiae]
MKIIPYQYAPYLNINKSSSFLVTTTTEKKEKNKVTKMTIKTKSKGDMSPTVGSFKSPISFISGENTFNLIRELKPVLLNNIYNDQFPKEEKMKQEKKEEEFSMTDQLPPKPIPNSKSNSVMTLLTPKSSKLDNLSFVTDEIFKCNSFKLNDCSQSSLDIINSAYPTSESELSQRITMTEADKLKEEEEEQRSKQEIKQEVKQEINQESNHENEKNQLRMNIRFKTDIILSPFSAKSPHPITIGNSSMIKDDLQSNMNGNVFQNQRFTAYLESINQFNHDSITNPMAKPLHSNYKTNINDWRSQLHHPSDMNRFTFPMIIEAFDEKSNKVKEMTPMTEEELQEWLGKATPEEMFDNMNKIVGLPEKMIIKSSKSLEAPLCVKFKNYNVSIYIKNGDFYCTTGDVKLSKLSVFPFPLHIAIGVSTCKNILNLHVVVQNTMKDYYIKNLSFITASETIALYYSDIIYQNIYYDEENILRTTFVQIYVDKDNEDLRVFVNRWFRVPYELAGCHYEIITDINQVSLAAQVYIFMTREKNMYKKLESINKWEDNMAIVHQTIYGHPLQVIMASVKERIYDRWMLDYNDWKRYK